MYTIIQTPEFDDWLDSVRNPVATAAITARIRRATLGNLGDWKPVADGVGEMRVDVGKGYRVYFVRRGSVLIVLLCGGDKSTQQKDIKRAKVLANNLRDLP